MVLLYYSIDVNDKPALSLLAWVANLGGHGVKSTMTHGGTQRDDDDGYIAAMTDRSLLMLLADVLFLNKGEHRAFMCEDGPHATKAGADNCFGYVPVGINSKFMLTLAPGGGSLVKRSKQNDGRP